MTTIQDLDAIQKNPNLKKWVTQIYAPRPRASDNYLNTKNYAIIQISGKQLWIQPQRFYDLNRLPFEPTTKITLKHVLLIKKRDSFHLGFPYIKGCTVEATIMNHLLGPKIVTYKMKPKKKMRKKKGHRQKMTRLYINWINRRNVAQKFLLKNI
jgi:large subunit ribosomal protein L21|uniref:ribosomal protein L21 n=1 Tax=Fibrocapsa japonica TaxID=94617 RepID=UPI002114144E|nr:ribosomal protein L21 [Fibrocapsa japonica]UTE95102.1 ribosomal protein L21 [Fibrocapsa japonica]